MQQKTRQIFRPIFCLLDKASNKPLMTDAATLCQSDPQCYDYDFTAILRGLGVRTDNVYSSTLTHISVLLVQGTIWTQYECPENIVHFEVEGMGWKRWRRKRWGKLCSAANHVVYIYKTPTLLSFLFTSPVLGVSWLGGQFQDHQLGNHSQNRHEETMNPLKATWERLLFAGDETWERGEDDNEANFKCSIWHQGNEIRWVFFFK